MGYLLQRQTEAKKVKKNFRSFKEAREFARSLGLKNYNEWREYTKSKNRPVDIPSNPNLIYSEYIDLGDWLGTGTIAPQKKYLNWLTFEKAKKYIQKTNVKSKRNWVKFTKSDDFPKFMPVDPPNAYKKYWIRWSDFLGTDNVKAGDIVYRSFEKSREYAKSLGLKSRQGWLKYAKSGELPKDIPNAPREAYRSKGWKGWGDFLWTGNVHKKDFLPFNEAREFARSLGLKGQKEWIEYSKSGQRPDDIPSSPDQTYKNKGWTNWGDFLGTGVIATFNLEFRSFEEVREFTRNLGLKNQREWQKYSKSGKRPDDIPSAPELVYKNKGWKGLGDWLGTGTIASFNREYRPFKEAREFVRNLGLKSNAEWQEYSKSGNKPDDIPSAPSGTYKNKGWITLGDWLGTGRIAPQNMNYLPYKEAREFVRSLGLKSGKEWYEYRKSGNRLDDIPASPNVVYKNKGWTSWGDFLGTGNIATFNREYRPFEEAREFVRSLGLKGWKEWNEYKKSGKRPNDIPSDPRYIYSKERLRRRK